MVWYETKDWSAFKDYSQHCRVGMYQSKTTEKGIELRVQAGKFCIILEFTDLQNEEQRNWHSEVLSFCETRGYIKVEGSIADEFFFV